MTKEYRAVKTYHEGKPVHVSQPEQEPVAWMHEWEDGGRIVKLHPRDNRSNDQPKSVRPLVYGDTTAPKQKPLTDERIREIWIEHGSDGDDAEGFARAIEAAHGIKAYP